jgi:hypothetical protein
MVRIVLALFFSRAASWAALASPSERLAITPGGREQGVGVAGSPCPVLCWPGCARKSQEPRPRALINGKASCCLVRFGFGRCWVCLGAGEDFRPTYICYRGCERC